MVLFELLALIIFLVILVKSSDYFVDYSSRIAKKLGISDFVIGLTLVALGTSLPELMSSIYASYIGNSDLVVGNIAGSNFANIGLILGIGGIIYMITIDKKMFKKEGMIMLFSTLLFLAFLYTNNEMNRTEGIILLILFILYTLYALGISINKIKRIGKTLINPKKLKNQGRIIKDFIIVLISAIGIFFGAKYTVTNAIKIANSLHIPEYIIAFTIIALGTSLPELSVTISSARKGLGNILMGNVIGSNIANILLVGGVSSIINPLRLTAIPTLIATLLITLLLVLFMKNLKINRKKGIFFLISYVLFIIWTALYI